MGGSVATRRIARAVCRPVAGGENTGESPLFDAAA
jgi:hypothetical protein